MCVWGHYLVAAIIFLLKNFEVDFKDTLFMKFWADANADV